MKTPAKTVRRSLVIEGQKDPPGRLQDSGGWEEQVGLQWAGPDHVVPLSPEIKCSGFGPRPL